MLDCRVINGVNDEVSRIRKDDSAENLELLGRFASQRLEQDITSCPPCSLNPKIVLPDNLHG